MKKLLTRILSGAIYVALFVAAIYSDKLTHNPLLGDLILSAFLLFVTIGGTFEYYRMMTLKGFQPNRFLGYLLVTCAFAATVAGTLYRDFFAWTCLAIILLCGLTLMLELWRCKDDPFGNIAHTFFPMLYVAIPLGLMVWLNSQGVLMMVVLLMWVNDSFAYLGGSLLGRHKLWTRHSPGKTWEGCLSGLLFTVAVAIFLGPLFQGLLNKFDWLVVGVMASVIGTLGDLVESMLKRSCGVKDSGKIMPGHGGFLDRFDSLLSVTPFVFIYTFWIMFVMN